MAGSMNAKILIVGGALILLGVVVTMYWQSRVDKFVAVGPRFTAYNGQELCVRIQELEKRLIGYAKPCNYGETK